MMIQNRGLQRRVESEIYSLLDVGFSYVNSLIAFLLGALVCIGGCSGGGGTYHLNPESGVSVPSAEKNKKQPVVNKTQVPRDEIDLVAAGRAYESGDIELAADLLKNVPATEKVLYLKSLIAEEMGDTTGAVALLRQIKGDFALLALETKFGLVKNLAAAGEYVQAIELARKLVADDTGISKKDKFKLETQIAGWLVETGQTEDALEAYLDLLEQGKDKEKEKNKLSLASLYIGLNKKTKAERLLVPIAYEGLSAGHMKQAIDLLSTFDKAPKWSREELLARAKLFMEYKAWDKALTSLGKITNNDDSIALEAKWLVAKIWFDRRGHYKEAVEAFDQIIKAKSTYADDARFFRARALSRLDRDEEAIAAYQQFIKLSKNPQKIADGRFLMGRLQFYLGKHNDAIRSFDKLVGSGKRILKQPRVMPGKARDAHFLLGLSAILAQKPQKAEASLKAASQGSSSREAIARNEYWYAVARLEGKKNDGKKLLRDICSKDPTGWYALMAGKRLALAKAKLGSCLSFDKADQNKELVKTIVKEKASPKVKSLGQLCPDALFWAEMGLYKKAAKVLKAAEKSKSAKGTARDWIVNYNLLDTPQYAIRKASLGMDWPPVAETRWRFDAAYPKPYQLLVDKAVKQHTLPDFLIYAIARKESLFNPNAVSHVGAMGMMQMMPQTFETNRKKAGLNPLKKGRLPTPEDSIKAAAFELKYLLDRFGGQLPLAIMGYNGGPQAVTRWLERSGGLPMDVFVEKVGFAQTRNYVRRVYATLVRYALLSNKPLPELPPVATGKKEG